MGNAYYDELKEKSKRMLRTETRIRLMRHELIESFRASEVSDSVFVHQMRRLLRMEEEAPAQEEAREIAAKESDIAHRKGESHSYYLRVKEQLDKVGEYREKMGVYGARAEGGKLRYHFKHKADKKISQSYDHRTGEMIITYREEEDEQD